MRREPFVWEVHLQQEVLDDAVAEIRSLPHEVIRQIVRRPIKRDVRGRDNRRYRLRVTATPTSSAADELEVTVKVKKGWFGRTISDRLRIGPERRA